jgi:hypothetical protein
LDFTEINQSITLFHSYTFLFDGVDYIQTTTKIKEYKWELYIDFRTVFFAFFDKFEYNGVSFIIIKIKMADLKNVEKVAQDIKDITIQ